MNKRLLILWILLIPFYTIAQQKVSIIPQPVSLSVQDGHFTIDKNTSIVFNKNENDLLHAANFFNAFVKNISGESLPYNTKKSKSVFLEIKKTDKIGDEGYLLDVTPNSIKLLQTIKLELFMECNLFFKLCLRYAQMLHYKYLV